jgi:fucose 4-O-acetylase-like acetyltransferase
MSFISRHIDNLWQMDWQTIAALAVICAVAAFFIKDCLAHPPFILFVYPFLLVFSILAQYFFLQAELFTPKKLDQWLMWTLLASTCGTLIGTGLLAAVAALRDRSGNQRV